MSSYVKIYYGPSDDFNTLSHKPQRFRGMQDKLLKLGYRAELVPVEFRNFCKIELCGYEVFRCNNRNLLFNVPHERDPVCRQAVAAVLSAAERARYAGTYFWLRSYILDQLFKRGKWSLPEYWPRPLDRPPAATVAECLDCCDIRTRLKRD